MKTLGIIIGIVMLIMAGTIGYLVNQADIPAGSVAPMGGYDYAQYNAALAASSTQIMAGAGIFGSVTVTEDAAVVVTFYDATSTAALAGASALYTTVAIMESAQAEGTYTFDTNLVNGLVMNCTSDAAFAGDWTVTYRQGY